MEFLFHVGEKDLPSSRHEDLPVGNVVGSPTNLPTAHPIGRVKVVRSDRPPERGRVVDVGTHRRGGGFVGTQRCDRESPYGRSELLVAPGDEVFGVFDGAAEVEQGHVPEIPGTEDTFPVGVRPEFLAERVGAEFVGVWAGGVQERKNTSGGYQEALEFHGQGCVTGTGSVERARASGRERILLRYRPPVFQRSDGDVCTVRSPAVQVVCPGEADGFLCQGGQHVLCWRWGQQDDAQWPACRPVAG